MIMGGQVDLRPQSGHPLAFHTVLSTRLLQGQEGYLMSTPAVVHSFVGKGTLWHQELCESRLRCFLCDFEQVT